MHIFFLLCIPLSAWGFLSIPKQNVRTSSNAMYVLHPSYYQETWFEKTTSQLGKKAKAIGRLIRAKNIPAISLIHFTGALIVNPDPRSFITNINFIASFVITHLVTFYSMVVNDLFDYQVDLINNPNRVLQKGHVTLVEASVLASMLGSIIFFINRYFLFDSQFVFVSMVLSTLYTPIFKRVPLIKNAMCSYVVASTLYFAGIHAQTSLFFPQVSLYLLSSTLIKMFTNSLFMEIWMDIRDKEGDSKNKIWTLPVLMGTHGAAWLGFCLYLTGGFVSSLFFMKKNPLFTFWLWLIDFPLILDFYLCDNDNFSQESVESFLKNSYYYLFVYLGSVLFIAFR